MSDLTPAARKLVEHYLGKVYDCLSACTEDEKNAFITQARSEIEETIDKARKDEIAAVTAVLRSLGEPDEFAARLRGAPEAKAEETPKTATWWHAIQVACTAVVIMEVLLAPVAIWALTQTKPTPPPPPVATVAQPPTGAPAVNPLPPPPPTYPPAPLTTVAPEVALVVRAARNGLSADELGKLPKDYPALAAQLGDPNLKAILDLFAALPQSTIDSLLKDGYLKWKFASLDAPRRSVFSRVLVAEIEKAANQGAPGDPTMSLRALNDAEVGFAGVDIANTKQKVISWYILFPKRSAPLWVTVVGGQAAGTAPYFQAHLRQIPLLRKMPDSPLP